MRQSLIGRPSALLLSLVLLPLALTGGCKTLSETRQSDALTRTLRGYHAAVRWSDFAAVLSYHKYDLDDADQAAADPAPLPLPEDYAHLRVTGYDVVYPPVQSSESTAQQMVLISYIDNNDQVLRRVQDRQTWLYDDKTKSWVITSPFPLPSSAPDY